MLVHIILQGVQEDTITWIINLFYLFICLYFVIMPTF